MSTNTNSFENYLFEALKALAKVVSKRFTEANLPFTIRQHYLMVLLKASDQQTQTELAELMNTDKSAILRQIDLLEKYNLVQRISDGEDRRKKKVVLTQEGIKQVTIANEIFATAARDLQEGIPAADLQTCISVLVRIRQNAINK